MKSILLAVILFTFSAQAAMSQSHLSQATAAVHKTSYQAASAGRTISVEPSVDYTGPTEATPARAANAHVANNIFKVNYRTLKRGQDHDLTLKNGTKSGVAKWNADNGTYTIYDTEQNVLGTVVYGKHGRYQVWSEENVMLKDSGNRVEKVLSYVVLVGIGIGVTTVATTGM